MGQYVIKIVDKWGNMSFVECEKWMNPQDKNVRMHVFEVVKHNEV